MEKLAETSIIYGDEDENLSTVFKPINKALKKFNLKITTEYDGLDSHIIRLIKR